MHVCAYVYIYMCITHDGLQTKTGSSLIALGCGLQTRATSLSSWRFTPAGVIGVLSNQYERLESIAREKVDSTRPSLTRVSLFFLFNSTSIIDSQTMNDDNRFSFPRYCPSRDAYFSIEQRGGYNAFLFNGAAGENGVRSSGVLHRFFTNYSGHLALIRCSRCFFASLSICFR